MHGLSKTKTRRCRRWTGLQAAKGSMTSGTCPNKNFTPGDLCILRLYSNFTELHFFFKMSKMPMKRAPWNLRKNIGGQKYLSISGKCTGHRVTKICPDYISQVVPTNLISYFFSKNFFSFYIQLAIWARFAGPVNSVHLDTIKFKLKNAPPRTLISQFYQYNTI